MGIKQVAESKKDYFMLDPAKIVVMDGFNVRRRTPELAAHLDGLKTSIMEIGIQEPLTVYMEGDEPRLTNGHCRLEAVMMARAEGADIKTVPCIVESRYSSQEDRTLSLIVRNAGKSLEPLEEAEVFKRLLGYGWQIGDIAKKTGRSVTHVNNMLELSAAAPEVKALVDAGDISATTAHKVTKQAGEEATAVLTKAIAKAKEKGKSKASLTDVKEVMAPAPAAPQEAPDEDKEAPAPVTPEGEAEGVQEAPKPRRDKAAYEAACKVLFVTLKEALASLEDGDVEYAKEYIEGTLTNYQDLID